MVTASMMNTLMAPLWAEAHLSIDREVLHPRLAELVEAEVVVLGGAVVFAKRARPNYRPAVGESLTGVEASVNKVYLDELVDTGQPGWAAKCIVQGVLLADRVLRMCASVTDLPVDVVLSADLGGSEVVGDDVIETIPSSTFRFYVRRGDDPWMSDDLDGFNQPVAVIRAS